MSTLSLTRRFVTGTILAGAFAAALPFAPAPAAAEGILFWSTQARPVEEAQRMRDMVLAGYGKPVDYQPQDGGPFNTRITAELQAGKGTIGLIGGIHGDFPSIQGGMADLSKFASGLKGVNAGLMDLGKLGTGEQKYIPWMQASYIMAANKQALKHLPAGADINALTYDQLLAWAKAVNAATGEKKLGFPAGPKGLINRFLQGYLYPSFTGSQVSKFRSADAVAMWGSMKTLWAESNPASANYGFMQEPLLTGEVWIAWDHAARLADALNQKPDDFVVFPAPAGPKGRGFMPVVAGMAIPKTAPDMAAAEALLAYMMKPETQIATLKATNFFPVVDVALPADLPNSAKLAGVAIAKQATAKDATASLLPVGMGALGGKFNKVYVDAFQRIVLGGEDIKTVLDAQAKELAAIMDEAKAPCWSPDKASAGTCPVE